MNTPEQVKAAKAGHAIDSGGWCLDCQCSGHVCQRHRAEVLAAEVERLSKDLEHEMTNNIARAGHSARFMRDKYDDAMSHNARLVEALRLVVGDMDALGELNCDLSTHAWEKAHAALSSSSEDCEKWLAGKIEEAISTRPKRAT